MTKAKTLLKTAYICQHCGSVHSKWSGKCQDCGLWNCLVEELIEKNPAASKNAAKLGESVGNFENLTDFGHEQQRVSTGNEEFDRTVGGGLVIGSALLIGGDPGIGKSTLLIQISASMAKENAKVAYISGEESLNQIRLRAQRLGIDNSHVCLLSETVLENIIAALDATQMRLVIIDSIQTLTSNCFTGAPGTVTQVKYCANELINYCKKKAITLMIIGHVTKDGQIAGPKVLEHMVDTVLYFETDGGNNFRIIRAIKNRFGGVNEIGVFEMRSGGLHQVNNPSELFISPLDRQISGSSVYAGIEGSRPILVEVQGLVAKSFIPTPRRAAVGWDHNRLSMLLAVLQVRYGLSCADKDVYFNIAGGLKINDPAIDLAVCSSIISAAINKPLPTNMVVFGEVGLSGEVRKVSQGEARIKEAIKLGFKRAIVPRGMELDYGKNSPHKLELFEISHVRELKDIIK
jgi:DNA repair protein RadA/Sms